MHKSGRVFLVEVFSGDESLADHTINELQAQALVDIADHSLRERPGTVTRSGRHRIIITLHADKDGNLRWGVGTDPSTITASLHAVLSSFERQQ